MQIYRDNSSCKIFIHGTQKLLFTALIKWKINDENVFLLLIGIFGDGILGVTKTPYRIVTIGIEAIFILIQLPRIRV